MAENEQGENGAEENGNGSLPAKPRARSGFGNPAWWDLVDVETGLTNREKKSLEARKLVEEGRLGGKQPGAGRPRKDKVLAEVVTEEASKKAPEIARQLIQMATQHSSPSVKLGAIDRINKFEQDLEKNMRDDEKELRKLSGKPLDERLAELLSNVGYDYDLPSSEVSEDV